MYSNQYNPPSQQQFQFQPQQQFPPRQPPPQQQFGQGQPPQQQQQFVPGQPPQQQQQFVPGQPPQQQQFGPRQTPPQQQQQQFGQPQPQQFGPRQTPPQQQFSPGLPPQQQQFSPGLPPQQQFGRQTPPQQQQFGRQTPTQQQQFGRQTPTQQKTFNVSFDTLNSIAQIILNNGIGQKSILDPQMEEVANTVQNQGASQLNADWAGGLFGFFLSRLSEPIIPSNLFSTFYFVMSTKSDCQRVKQLRVFFSKLNEASKNLIQLILQIISSCKLQAMQAGQLFGPAFTHNNSPNFSSQMSSAILSGLSSAFSNADYLLYLTDDVQDCNFNIPETPSKNLRAIVRFSYTSTSDNIHSLNVNDTVILESAHKGDWLKGILNGASKFLPSGFVELIQEPFPANVSYGSNGLPPLKNISSGANGLPPLNPTPNSRASNISYGSNGLPPLRSSFSTGPNGPPAGGPPAGGPPAGGPFGGPPAGGPPAGGPPAGAPNARTGFNPNQNFQVPSQSRTYGAGEFPAFPAYNSNQSGQSGRRTLGSNDFPPVPEISGIKNVVNGNENRNSPLSQRSTESEFVLNEFRIAVVGSGGTGKSALTIAFVQNQFIEEYDPTIEDSYRKQVTVDGKPCFLSIMDTAGQEEYSAMRDQYMRNGQGFLLVFSLTSRESFNEIVPLRDRILVIKDSNSVPIFIAANKSDLTSEHQVSQDEVRNLASSFKCNYLMTSAKDHYNVEQCFEELVREIRKSVTVSKENRRRRNRCSIL